MKAFIKQTDLIRKELQKINRAEVEFKEKEKHLNQKQRKIEKTMQNVTELVQFLLLRNNSRNQKMNYGSVILMQT